MALLTLLTKVCATLYRTFVKDYDVKDEAVDLDNPSGSNFILYLKKLIDHLFGKAQFLTENQSQARYNGQDVILDSRPQSVVDFITSIFSFSNSIFSKVFSKATLTVIKDILPVLNLIKAGNDVSKLLAKGLQKFFGCFLTDTRDWLAWELRDKKSPVHLYSSWALEYFRAYSKDDVAAQSVAQHELKTHLPTCIQYLKDNDRYDNFSIRFLKDMEYCTGRPLLPISRRFEPFVLNLYGKPGQGKSSTVASLVGPIFGCRTKAEFDEMTYYRGLSEYWDGYGDKKIVVYDDFGQDRKEETDYREFISLVTTAPFLPNFASLVGKNPKGTSISPAMVVCLSNREEHNPMSISHPGAVERRLHFKIEVALNDSGQTKYRVENKWLSIKEAQLAVYNAYAEFDEMTYYRGLSEYWDVSVM